MLSKPAEFSEDELQAFLADNWQMSIASLQYLAVGSGTHHWVARATSGNEFFVNVDDFRAKSSPRDEDRLYKSLIGINETLQWISGEDDIDFVVPPFATSSGQFIKRFKAAFVVVVFPKIEGKSEAVDHPNYSTDERRLAVIDAVGRLHSLTPRVPVGQVGVENFAATRENEFALATAQLSQPWHSGPYAERCRALLLDNQDELTEFFAAHNQLRRRVLNTRYRWVLTHGETHAANAMFNGQQLHLIDWDTMLIAPPERDLRPIIKEPSDLRVYESRFGSFDFDDSALVLYRMYWDVEELTGIAVGFFNPHEQSEDTEQSWDAIEESMSRILFK